jgi:hypothetical protein
LIFFLVRRLEEAKQSVFWSGGVSLWNLASLFLVLKGSLLVRVRAFHDDAKRNDEIFAFHRRREERESRPDSESLSLHSQQTTTVLLLLGVLLFLFSIVSSPTANISTINRQFNYSTSN